MSGEEREPEPFFPVRPDPMVPKGYVELHDENGILYRVRVAFPEATEEGESP